MVTMPTLSLLYLDNDDYAYKSYSSQIQEHWSDLYGYRPSIEHVNTIETALGKLAQTPLPYQVLIADLLFPPLDDPGASADRHLPRGLEVVAAGARKQKLLIFAISQGKPDGFPRLGEEAINKGAHLFKFRGELADPLGPGIRGLCKELHELLIRHEILPDDLAFEYDPSEPRLSVIVTEIGKPTLKALAKTALSARGAPERFVARYIAPGMSGAYVLKLEAFQAKRPRANYLLKVSRSRDRLSRELKNYPHGIYSNRLLVRYLPLPDQGISQVGEWFAIAADFEESAKTLRQWLSDRVVGDVDSVLRSLFLKHGLTNGYKENLNPSGASAVDSLFPNDSRSARILDSIEEFGSIVSDSECGGESEWTVKAGELKSLLLKKRFKNFDAKDSTLPCHMCQCHGDLHARNILITDAQGPLLIDTADCGVLHWCADYARLLVDLVVAVYDYGIVSYKWSGMAHWREIVRRMSAGQALPTSGDSSRDKKNKKVRAAITWLVDNRREICPAIASDDDFRAREWELQLAVGIELLRASYRVDLTTPKRVLGLLSGYAILVEASATRQQS